MAHPDGVEGKRRDTGERRLDGIYPQMADEIGLFQVEALHHN